MDVSDRLADAYSNMLKLDGYAYGCNNITVAKLSPDLDWLPAFRNHISILNDSCVLWMKNRPSLWSDLLIPFSNYTSLFSGFTKLADQLNTKDQWLEALQQLSDALKQAKNDTKSATSKFDQYFQNIKDVQFLLDESIEDGWKALSEEETEMQKIAAALQHLQDTVESLEDNLSGAMLRSGQSYIQSSISICYTLVSTAGASVPFLSVAGLAFTVGKTFYDIISTDKEVEKTLNEITELQNQASKVAQATAATKMILYSTYNLEKQFLGVQYNIQLFTGIWDNEIVKVQTVANAIQSGADPKLYFDLKSMPSALATDCSIFCVINPSTKSSDAPG